MVGLMEDAGIETRQYRRQLIAVTGAITTDVLDVELLPISSRTGVVRYLMLLQQRVRSGD